MSTYKPGDCVYTSYGAGVIVGSSDNFYSVRLWRVPGKSIGTSSLAYLGSSAILNTLPAAPGMITQIITDDEKTEKKHVLVHCYYKNSNEFLLSPLSTDVPKISDIAQVFRRGSVALTDDSVITEFLTCIPEQLALSPSAKFYPVLQSLMVRSEQAAVATNHFLRNETTKRVLNSTGKILQEGVTKIEAHGERVMSVTAPGEKLEELASQVENTAPELEKNIKQVIKMVKDEELTVLLEKCKERLEDLVSTDLPTKTKEVLENTGIRIVLDETKTFSDSMVNSRQEALDALHELLKQAELDDLEKVRRDLSNNFANAFDSLSKAAKSDRGLNEIFESVTKRTTEWQEATGRLMTTRSASLFVEGATRLQARAAAIFGQGQFQAFGEIGSKLTKSFTEGDIALARLKSIELGEAVKTRLMDAIEIRSESLGGLDGIIAGALSTVKDTGSSNKIQDLLKSLQVTATSATKDAHETLIAILSSQSKYRELALLRIEQALCDLQDQIGDDLTPDQIASIVRGEGGTAKIFEPIAQRAMKQIEKHLDTAEAQVEDAAVLDVLSKIRKIMSGEMTLDDVMNDLVNILNDDKVVAAGEQIVLQGEQVLDAIEGVSGNKAVADALQIAEKAGITKDSVMREFEKLNVDELLGVAGDAVTDEKARRKLVSSATDAALDFVLRILPSMPVPPFEGVKDGLLYNISNLSMKGFRVRKEDIQIELAGMRATQRRRARRKDSAETSSFDGSDDGSNMPEIRKTQSQDSSFSSAGSDYDVEEIHTSVSATELLIIDIRNISALLENALWSFEQTYLPYLKGQGGANVRMYGGAIRLQFELRKRKKAGSSPEEVEWEPVLCLHDRSCEIAEVELSLEGQSKLTWILNKLAAIFKGPLRDYVVSTIVKVMSNRSGWILARLNTVLSPYWELILRTAKLKMDDLVEADDAVIVTEIASENSNFVELVWKERLPLGMNLLTNDNSGLLRVVDFPRGSQARIVCEKRGFDPDAFKSASVVAVNGSTYEDSDDLFEALKDPGRPKSVGFRLADTADAERLRKLLEKHSKSPKEAEAKSPREFNLRKVLFNDAGELGIDFSPAIDGVGLVVKGFVERDDGTILAAEKSGDIKVGDILTHVNDKPAIFEGDGKMQAIRLLESVAETRPLQLTFSDSYLKRVVVSKQLNSAELESTGGPSELILAERKDGDKRRIFFNGFNDVSGSAESSGILIGDHIVFINGMPVGAGCRWLDTPSAPSFDEVTEMLNDVNNYPIGVTFAHPKRDKGTRWSAGTSTFSDSDAETICVTANSQERLGCVLESVDHNDIIVTDFTAVPGIFQRALSCCKDSNGDICLSFEQINGQFVPSYATIDMVAGALKRTWVSADSIELLLCDDELKSWLLSKLLEAE